MAKGEDETVREMEIVVFGCPLFHFCSVDRWGDGLRQIWWKCVGDDVGAAWIDSDRTIPIWI